VAVLLAAASLAACSAAEVPAPITLSYPYSASEEPGVERSKVLARRVAGAYVRVLVYEQSDARDAPARTIVNGGSGAIVDARGLVLTTAHIAKDRRFAAEVMTMDGRTHQATIVDVAPSRELALLKVEPSPSLAAPERADPRFLAAGQPVFGIGTPDNVSGVVSFGHILSPQHPDRITYAEYGFDNAIEIDMEIEPGHSGGPVFDAEGRLIGLLASFALGDTRRVPYVSTRLAYAIPISAVAAYLASVAPP
jgi:S1-C subfamily serine protease